MQKFCPSEELDEVEGDLVELYLRRRSRYGKAIANLGRFFEVLGFFNFQVLKNPRLSTGVWTVFRSAIKSGGRQVLTHKSSHLSNLVAIALSIATFLYLSAFILKEESYDQFHKNAQSAYRLYTEGTFERGNSIVPLSIGTHIEQNLPEVINSVRMERSHHVNVSDESGDNRFYERLFVQVDDAFFDVFDYQFLDGSARGLKTPNALLISDRLAQRYFGKLNVVGETLTIENTDYLIQGVFENIREKSHLDFELIASISKTAGQGFSSQGWTYLQLKGGTDPIIFEEKINELDMSALVPSAKMNLRVQPVTDIHLKSDLLAEIGTNGNYNSIRTLKLISFLLLTLAIAGFINFISVAVFKRSKEVALRRIMGSLRSQFFVQFTTESLVILTLSLGFAFLLTLSLSGLFEQVTGVNLSAAEIMNPQTTLLLVFLLLAVGVISSLYPTIVFSSLKPVLFLRSGLVQSSGKALFRSALISLQLIITCGLIISTLVIYQQIDYLSNADLGYKKDHVLILPLTSSKLRENYALIKSELNDIPAVSMVAASQSSPLGAGFQRSLEVEGVQYTVKQMSVDIEYFELLKLLTKEGRTFSAELQTDKLSTVVINESMAALLDQEDVLGASVSTFMAEKKVIGVIKDYHVGSLHEQAVPMIFEYDPGYFSYFLISFESTDVSSLIDQVGGVISEFDAEVPFEFDFLDQAYARKYQEERQLGKIFVWFSVVTVIIGIVGVFSILSFYFQSRMMELSIRKILGSSNTSLAFVISKETLYASIIAVTLASVLGYYGLKSWLDAFAMRIELSLWLPLYSVALLGVILLSILLSVLRRVHLMNIRIQLIQN